MSYTRVPFLCHMYIKHCNDPKNIRKKNEESISLTGNVNTYLSHVTTKNSTFAITKYYV